MFKRMDKRFYLKTNFSLTDIRSAIKDIYLFRKLIYYISLIYVNDRYSRWKIRYKIIIPYTL